MITIKKKSLIIDRKIKVALVGCGRISKKHFDAFEKHKENLDLVAVCDTNEKRLEEAKNSCNVLGYYSLEEALKKSDADLYVLCTPSGLHPEQSIQVAQAGKHCVTEKPMATQWEDGKNMVKAFDQSGTFLFVVKQNRHNSTLQLLKNAVDEGRFGKIYNVNLNVFWSRPQAYYDQDSWRGTWEFDGGALMNQASHYLDLLNWLIGPVESLYAYTATQARNIEVEDSGVICLKWRSGALGTVNVSMLTYPKNYEGSITIIGERGTVRVGGVAVNEIQTWDFQDKLSDDELIQKSNYETTSVYGFGHPFYYDNVIQSLRGEAEPYTSGRSGLKSLEVLIAAYRSAKQGQAIPLPLD